MLHAIPVENNRRSPGALRCNHLSGNATVRQAEIVGRVGSDRVYEGITDTVAAYPGERRTTSRVSSILHLTFSTFTIIGSAVFYA